MTDAPAAAPGPLPAAVTGSAAQALILASSSPYRRGLLQRLGVTFTCINPAIDETPRPGETAHGLVTRLALAKAEAAAVAAGLVIGSDQVALCGGEIMGKPGDRAGAIRQLTAAAGRTLQFYTGVALRDAASGRHELDCVTTEVKFRPLSQATIEAYVDQEPAFDCAGGFKAEGLGITLFTALRSDDPTALTGLPLITLARQLAVFGFVLPAQPEGVPHAADNTRAAAFQDPLD